MIKKILFIACVLSSAYSPVFSQGSWLAKANLGPNTNYSRSKPSSFVINGLGYVGCGYNGTARVDLWAYNPTNNTWTQKANFGGSTRFGAFGFAINGDGYIGCGYSAPSYVKDVWKYDVTGNSWTKVADFGGSSRSDASSFVIGNRTIAATRLIEKEPITPLK